MQTKYFNILANNEKNVYFKGLFTDFKVLGSASSNNRFPQSALGGSRTQQ